MVEIMDFPAIWAISVPIANAMGKPECSTGSHHPRSSHPEEAPMTPTEKTDQNQTGPENADAGNGHVHV